MDQHTISLIIESVTLVLLCVMWRRINKIDASLRRIQRQRSQTSDGVRQPADDLSLRLERLQTMKFSPINNVVSPEKRRETK